MTDKQVNQGIYLCAVSGLLAIVFYMLSTMINLPFKISYLMFMHTGILISISVASLYNIIHKKINNFACRLGLLLLFSAGLLHSTMACMQGSNRVWYNNHHEEVSREIFIGIFSSQLGIDFVFDMAISFGLFFFCLGLFNLRLLPRILTLSGMVISLGGYLVNAFSFPMNPGESGWIDPGPFFSIWFLIFIVTIIYKYIKTRSIFE